MRFCLIQDLFRRAVFHKNPQNLSVPAVFVLHQRIQLAVRESACTAFTELYVGSRIQHPFPPEFLHIRLTLFHRAAPLQKQRPVAMFRQQIAAKQPCRPRTDDNRPAVPGLHPVSRCRKPVCLLFHRLYLPAPAPGKYFLRRRHGYIQRIYDPDLRLLSGINRLLNDLPGQDRRRGDTQQGGRLTQHILLRMLQRNLDLADPNHFPFLFLHQLTCPSRPASYAPHPDACPSSGKTLPFRPPRVRPPHRCSTPTAGYTRRRSRRYPAFPLQKTVPAA